MKEWRKQVYQRDNYTCQICGDRQYRGHKVELNSHHIERFSDNEALRVSVDNGITLCISCHKLTIGKESQYEEQFKSIVTRKVLGI